MKDIIAIKLWRFLTPEVVIWKFNFILCLFVLLLDIKYYQFHIYIYQFAHFLYILRLMFKNTELN